MPSNLGSLGEHGMSGGSLHHGLPSSGSIGNLQAMQAGMPLSGMPGLMGSNGDIHMMGSAAMMMAAAHAQAQQHSGSPVAATGGRNGAIKLGRGVTDPACYQHKLFIGQIPFEVGHARRTRADRRWHARPVHWPALRSSWSRSCDRLRIPRRPLSKTCGPCSFLPATSWSWPSCGRRGAPKAAPSLPTPRASRWARSAALPPPPATALPPPLPSCLAAPGQQPRPAA
jgi:hypothetical protein